MIRQSYPTPVRASAANDGLAIDWLAMLWQRKLVVASVAMLVVALGGLYHKKATPIYKSSAQLLLIKNEAELPITAAGHVSYEDALSTHMILIRSPLIVGKAVTDHELHKLPSFDNIQNPVDAIIRGLEAVRGGTRDAPDPYVMNLHYRGVNRMDCAVVLNSIVKSYQDYIENEYRSVSNQTVSLIREAKDKLGQQLNETESAYQRFRENSPHLLTNAHGERTNVHELRMSEIERARSQQLLKNTEIKAQIDSIEFALARGGSREALNLLARKAESLSSHRSPGEAVEREFFDTSLEEQLLLENFGEDHPDVVTVRKKIAILREHLGSFPSNSHSPSTDFLAVYLDSLRQEFGVGEDRLNKLNDLFQQERQAAKSLAASQLADEAYRNKISRTQQLFDGVIKHLEELSLVRDPGGIKAQLISPPAIGAQVEPNLVVTAVLSLVLGLIAGTASGYTAERLDRRFRSPDDLRQELGLPVVGHIPVIGHANASNREADSGELDSSLCTFFHPEASASEAYRAVRTALFFSARGSGHRVVQVTSPTPGDGKTTLSANLAISVAMTGKQVLLIDADFRRPRLGGMFAVDDSIGFSSVIDRQADLDDAIKATAINNLSLMPCGPRPSNPSEQLTSPRFQEILDSVRDRFDLVIVDTPPLLAVTDPAAVAPRVDTVLLVVSLSRSVRGVANRAAEMLESLGANVLGVVVNRFDAKFGYSSYGYRDKYGYEYGNQYNRANNGEPTRNGKRRLHQAK